jgi:hypothetical protein
VPRAGPGAGPSVPVSVAASQPGASGRRRARAWYSGPCFRGSAYSLGLIVQYVPLVVPYHDPPDHSGSNGSKSASSYVVEPGVARPGRSLPGRGLALAGPAPALPRGRAWPAAAPASSPAAALAGPLAAPLARLALARSGFAHQPALRRPVALGLDSPVSWSYAAWIARNRGIAASPAVSGWNVLARRR